MSAGPASSQGSGGSTNAAARSAMTSNQAYDLTKTKTKKTFSGEYSKENQNPNNNIQTKKKKTTVVNNGGGNNGGGSDNNNTITQVTKTAPTEAEVSQSTTTEADADTEANRLLKIKKRGRSASIMTGSQGVTKTSTDYSLGKKSLLGRV